MPRLLLSAVLCSALLSAVQVNAQQYRDFRPLQTQLKVEPATQGLRVLLGPVALSLPKNWQALATPLGADLLSPSGQKLGVLVLEPRSESSLAKLASAEISVFEAMTQLCAPAVPAKVAALQNKNGAKIHFSSCDGSNYDGSPTYVLFYELRNSQFVVQLIADGRGKVVDMRRFLDPIAGSASLE